MRQTADVDFLLECVGFAPDEDADALVTLARERGERDPLRGPGGEHYVLPLAEGVALHCDREEGSELWTLMPHYRERRRLRVAVTSVRTPEDSPFDALLRGWAGPTREAFGDEWGEPGAYELACLLFDARRLPRRSLPGRVISVAVAGFALAVDFVGPNADAPDEGVLERPHGARLAPATGPDAPGGCREVSLRVMRVRRATNRCSGRAMTVLECDAPERSLHLFLSPGQLEADGLPEPRPGWRVEGCFLFTGRVTGGLPGPSARARRHFG